MNAPIIEHEPLMPTGETVAQWKARHNAVIGRALAAVAIPARRSYDQPDLEAEIGEAMHACIKRKCLEDEQDRAGCIWRALMRSPAVRRVFADYAEATFRRTGGILPVLMLAGILAVAWVAEQKLAVM
jgi:hypothetical protein